MKTFIFIHGPNGVGKSTACKTIHHRLANTAWLESEWCRMTLDGRVQARIQCALAARHLYDALHYPTIDTTRLTFDQTADCVIKMIESFA